MGGREAPPAQERAARGRRPQDPEMEVGGHPLVGHETGTRGSAGPSGGPLPRQPGPNTELGPTQARPRAPSTPPPSASLQTGNPAQNTEIPGDWLASLSLPGASWPRPECRGGNPLQRPRSSDRGPDRGAPPGVLSAAGAGTRWALCHTSRGLCSLPSTAGLGGWGQGWGRAGQNQTAG